MVHADVYADNAATTSRRPSRRWALQYEPMIYFCDADGTIVDRLDAMWDAAELDRADRCCWPDG